MSTAASDDGWHIRPYEPADRAELDQMYADFEPKRAAQGLPPDEPARRRDWLDHVLAHGTHAVARLDRCIVGHVMLVPLDDTTVELANFVHQSYRGRGLGTALNVAAVDMAAGRGWRRVWLCVDPSNRAAIRSYTKAGFRPVRPGAWSSEIEMFVDLAHATDPPPDDDA